MNDNGDNADRPASSGSTDTSAHAAERISTGRRALLRAGWVAPVIVVVSLPKDSFAGNMSGGTLQPPRLQPPPLPSTPPWWWPRNWPWPPW